MFSSLTDGNGRGEAGVREFVGQQSVEESAGTVAERETEAEWRPFLNSESCADGGSYWVNLSECPAADDDDSKGESPYWFPPEVWEFPGPPATVAAIDDDSNYFECFGSEVED